MHQLIASQNLSLIYLNVESEINLMKIRQDRNFVVGIVTSIIILSSIIIFSSISIDLPPLTIKKTTTSEEKQNYQNNIFNHNDIEAFAQKEDKKPLPVIRHSKILDFNGVNYADVTNSSDINLDSFTISLWFNSEMNVTGRDTAFLLNKGGFGKDTLGDNLNYGMWLDNKEKINGGFESILGKDYFLTSPESYADGRWHNTILTFDESLHLLKLYVDGLEVATNATLIGITPDNTGTQTVRFGANSFVEKGKVNGNYTGKLDDIQVWDFAFTKPQVTNLFNTESKMTR